MKHKKSIYSVNSKTVHFQRLQNSQGLANLLHFEFNSFKRVVENASYTEFSIPKKKGGKRVIESPNEYLSLIQKRLNDYLQAVYYKIKPTHVYGFIQSVKGEQSTCTIFSNAQNHVGKDYVLNIDLKDYFHSVTSTQVRDFFQSGRFNFSEDLATCIALICCWKGRLPMGASTSPVVANLLSLKLDEQLIALASFYNLTYTRYADDLTFSSNEKISDEMILKIKALIVGCEFEVNNKKVRLQSKYSQQTVTELR
ncbi:MAG: RNA-directed DNA polymerase [Bacteroidetes bacterium]|nr:RNA-directed DNA polymerase [Bacteroidota bacterium]